MDDLRRALSRPADAKKLARMEELIFMNEVIKRARKLTDATDDFATAEKLATDDGDKKKKAKE